MSIFPGTAPSAGARPGRRGSQITQKAYLAICGLWFALGGLAQSPPPTAAYPAELADPSAVDPGSLLNTKVTTSSRFSNKVSDVAGVTVVTQVDIRGFRGTTAPEVPKPVSGLNVMVTLQADSSMIAVGGGQSGPDGGDRLIILDGCPVRQISEAGTRWRMTFNATDSRSVMGAPGYPGIDCDSYKGDLEWTSLVAWSARRIPHHTARDGRDRGSNQAKRI